MSYTYDGFLPQSTTWAGAITGSLTRKFNSDFEVTELAVNGQPITFGYDADGLLTKAGHLSLTRDPQNGLVSNTLLGNTATALSYNGFGESLSSRASFIAFPSGPEGPESPPETPPEGSEGPPEGPPESPPEGPPESPPEGPPEG